MKKKLFSLLLLFVLGITTQVFAQPTNTKATKEIDKVSVVVKQVGTIYVLTTNIGKKTTYVPTNLAKRYQKAGLKLVVSGVVGKVDPTKKSVGIPLRLTYSNPVAQTTRAGDTKKSETKDVKVAGEGDLKKGSGAFKKTTKVNKTSTTSGPKEGSLEGNTKPKPKPTKTETITKDSFNDSVGKKETLTAKKGIIAKIGGTFVIKTEDGKRYVPDNLALKFKKPGLKVKVSGEIGKVPDNVRMVGTPLKITSIQPFLSGGSKNKRKNKFKRKKN